MEAGRCRSPCFLMFDVNNPRVDAEDMAEKLPVKRDWEAKPQPPHSYDIIVNRAVDDKSGIG